MGISVFALKAAVVTALQALVPTTADLVQGGMPAEVPPIALRRRVYVLNVARDEPLLIYVPGSQIRTETYELPIALEVVKFTGHSPTGYADTETEMGALVAAIETLCANDPSWGGVVFQSGLALASESCGPYGEQAGTGWCAHALLELHVMRKGA